MGKSTISMAISNSYVKLPGGKSSDHWPEKSTDTSVGPIHTTPWSRDHLAHHLVHRLRLGNPKRAWRKAMPFFGSLSWVVQLAGWYGIKRNRYIHICIYVICIYIWYMYIYIWYMYIYIYIIYVYIYIWYMYIYDICIYIYDMCIYMIYVYMYMIYIYMIYVYIYDMYIYDICIYIWYVYIYDMCIYLYIWYVYICDMYIYIWYVYIYDIVYIWYVYIYMICIYILYMICIYIYDICVYIWYVYIYDIYIYMICIYIYMICIYIWYMYIYIYDMYIYMIYSMISHMYNPLKQHPVDQSFLVSIWWMIMILVDSYSYSWGRGQDVKNFLKKKTFLNGNGYWTAKKNVNIQALKQCPATQMLLIGRSAPGSQLSPWRLLSYFPQGLCA